MKTAVNQLSSQINMAKGKDSVQVIESCANQIGSFIRLPESTGCDGSEFSQLKSEAMNEYKITTGIKNHAIEVKDFASYANNINLHFR